MAGELKKVSPDICTYVDDQHEKLYIEISLPGVEKDRIQLRMHEDSFNLSAPRNDREYVATFSFCCPVQPEKAKAGYRHGLLKIAAPFRDATEDSVRIDIE